MEMDTHNATMPPATAFGQLRLIEIMRNVVSQTDSVKALAHCARLNSDWYCEVIPRLWRGQGYDVMSAEDDWRTPSVEFLNNLAVVSKSRLNALLRNVRFLDLWSVKDPDDISESDEDARLDPRYLPRKRGPQDAPALWAPEVWHRVRPLVLRTDAGFRGLREKDFRVLLKPSLRLVELTTDDCGVRFFEILQVSSKLEFMLAMVLDGHAMSM